MTGESERKAIVELLARQLALGVSPAEAVSRLQSATSAFAGELREIHAALSQGREIPSVPRLLPAEFPALLRAGRSSGNLPEVMQRASDHLAALHSALRAALLPLYYPLVLLSMLWLVALSLSRVLLPMVPGSGGGAISAVGSLVFGAVLLLAAALLNYWCYWRRKWSSRGNVVTRAAEALFGRLPGLRALFELPALASAAGSLAVTLRAGVDGPTALRLAAEGCRSARISGALSEASSAHDGGEPLTKVLQRPALPGVFRAVGLAAPPDPSGEDWAEAFDMVSTGAFAQLEVQARRLSVASVSSGLLLAALFVGLVLAAAYGLLAGLSGGIVG